MSNIKTWISAFRLRTLPLAVSGILMGSALADLNGIDGSKGITILALLTAVCLQILSNLANDYGDFSKGTDNEKRLGNMRALQSGEITPKAMLRMMIVFVILCLAFGLTLLYVASDGNINYSFVLFFALGLASIAAAIKYTVGKSAYGYSGFGDVFVFIFFGLVSVLGVYMLNKHFTWNWSFDGLMLLPAIAMGLLSTAVLNTNNIRDIDNDRASNKNTIVVKMGLSKARIYHWFLLLGAFVCMLVFVRMQFIHVIQYLSLLAFIPIFIQGYKVQTTAPSQVFNGYLKQLSLSTLLFVVVYILLQTAGIFILGYQTIQKFQH